MESAEQILKFQRIFFAANQTKNINFRIANLKKLKSAIQLNKEKIALALYSDLHKSYEEAYLTEISIVLSEIDFHVSNLKSWARPKPIHTPSYLLPSKSRVIVEPLGIALIIAPWNYPFQLVINPLIGAIAAGCCAIVKPSPYTPNVAQLIADLIGDLFPKEYISVIQGGRAVNTALLSQKFDVIFFTGGSQFGKVVMEAAAKNLTPVILELGGKSPCIVDKSANIKIAAKRIIWGKLINAGQTCIAPDYIIVHNSVKEDLIKEMIAAAHKMYGSDFKKSDYFPRIVNEQAFDRLCNLLSDGRVRWGAETDRETKYISPTILDDISLESEIMKQEIFGPILPIISFNNVDEVLQLINTKEKPLALYAFGNNKFTNFIMQNTSSGGVCVNDTLLHVANHHLPFGGVGNSGMGKYHGEHSFLAFSNQRAVFSSPTWIDIVFKYPPFKFFNLIKKII